MLKKFIKYVSQNMLGMVGMSVYILADTYFIFVADRRTNAHHRTDRKNNIINWQTQI